MLLHGNLTLSTVSTHLAACVGRVCISINSQPGEAHVIARRLTICAGAPGDLLTHFRNRTVSCSFCLPAQLCSIVLSDTLQGEPEEANESHNALLKANCLFVSSGGYLLRPQLRRRSCCFKMHQG